MPAERTLPAGPFARRPPKTVKTRKSESEPGPPYAGRSYARAGAVYEWEPENSQVAETLAAAARRPTPPGILGAPISATVMVLGGGT